MKHRRLWRTLGAVVLTPLLLYLGLVVWFWSNQERLLFAGDPHRTAPAAVGLPQFEEVSIPTADGERLVAWWYPPAPGEGAVLYFGGNGGAIALRNDRYRDLVREGFGVLAVSYRGYGGSSGKPSEPALLADAHAALDWLAARAPVQRTAVFGESLGSGVAVALAADREVGGVLLDSPYNSIDGVAARLYPWLPVRQLARHRFDSGKRIAAVTEPVLMVHCDADALIPLAEARRLRARAGANAELLVLPGCGHTATWYQPRGRDRMMGALRGYVAAS